MRQGTPTGWSGVFQDSRVVRGPGEEPSAAPPHPGSQARFTCFALLAHHFGALAFQVNSLLPSKQRVEESWGLLSIGGAGVEVGGVARWVVRGTPKARPAMRWVF